MTKKIVLILVLALLRGLSTTLGITEVQNRDVAGFEKKARTRRS